MTAHPSVAPDTLNTSARAHPARNSVGKSPARVAANLDSSTVLPEAR